MKAASVVGLTRLPDIVAFHSYCRGRYGVVHEGTPPYLVSHEEDADKIGLNLPVDLDALASDTTLWWEIRGGHLFTFTWRPDQTPPVATETTIGWFLGDYKAGPGTYPFVR